MTRLFRITCCAAMLLTGSAVWAQDHQHGGHAAPAASAAAAASELVDGEVVAADPQTRRVKIKHGEIKSINMAPMNAMPFQVNDEAMFAKLKPGSKIRFTTAKVNGAYVLLTVEVVN